MISKMPSRRKSTFHESYTRILGGDSQMEGALRRRRQSRERYVTKSKNEWREAELAGK